MRDLQKNNDALAKAPLDFRYVILGLLMLVAGAVIMVFVQNYWIKHVGISLFVVSFFVMSKKKLKK